MGWPGFKLESTGMHTAGTSNGLIHMLDNVDDAGIERPERGL